MILLEKQLDAKSVVDAARAVINKGNAEILVVSMGAAHLNQSKSKLSPADKNHDRETL